MNVEQDTKEHIELVARFISRIRKELGSRAICHDRSKLRSPEKEMYDTWRPKLDVLDIKSQEYKDALTQMMKDALPHHYAANRHHPEHFENGLAGMNVVDLTEMICDWFAAAQRKNQTVDMAWVEQRFKIEKGTLLYAIIENTVEAFKQGKFD